MKEPTIRDLFPEFNEKELKEAEENVEQYFLHADDEGKNSLNYGVDREFADAFCEQ